MPDEKLPADDDNKKENPFEEFINRDLGMDSVLRQGASTTPDDDEDVLASLYRQREMTEDNDDDDEDSSRFSPRFGSFTSRIPPSSATPGDSPFRSFGSRSPFGPSSSSPSPFSRPSSRMTGMGSPLKFSRPQPEPPRTPWQRLAESLNKLISEEVIFLLIGFAALLIMASTLLYIDNLRLSIAVRDGQIQELRTQLMDLQRQLTPTAELPSEPPTETRNQ
ncbi:MAG: hypothetical protein SNJ54_13110 [Anaerolineae bacterium]